MKYIVNIDYLKFDIPDANTALSFAELAKKYIITERPSSVSIEITEEDNNNE